MAGVRFEDVDLLGALSRIVDLHTQHYKEDFDLDKELISKLAVSDRSEVSASSMNSSSIPFIALENF